MEEKKTYKFIIKISSHKKITLEIQGYDVTEKF